MQVNVLRCWKRRHNLARSAIAAWRGARKVSERALRHEHHCLVLVRPAADGRISVVQPELV